MSEPRVLHFTPFVNLSGANRSLLTLVKEHNRTTPTTVMVLVDGDIADALRDAGIEVIVAMPASQVTGARWGRLGTAARVLTSTLAAGRFRLIHAHSARAMRFLWPTAALFGVPVLAHQRDAYERDYFHIGLSRARQLVAVSTWVRSTLPAELRARCTVVHNAVSVGDSVVNPDGTPRISMAARCVPGKGALFLLNALESLWSRFDFDVEVRGVDDSPFGRELRHRVEMLPPQHRARVELCPFGVEMDSFYEKAHIVVVPSLDPEPFGRVAVEAMAHGRAVVAADHGGLSEFIVPGVNGCLFQPRDTESLRQVLAELLQDPVRARILGQSAHTDAKLRFSPTEHAEALRRIYRRLVAEG